MAAFTNRINGPLAPKDQEKKREGLQCAGTEMQAKLTHGQDARAEARAGSSRAATPATVSLPMLQAFGFCEGRTLSVVNDIERKSPVIITMTISMGVKIACPVMMRPATRNSTVTIFLITEFSV